MLVSLIIIVIVVANVGFAIAVFGALWWEESEAWRAQRRVRIAEKRAHRQAVNNGLYEEQPPRFS